MPTDPAVQEFLDGFEHPMKAEIQAIRELIVNCDPSITEGIKWNSMSFRTTEWFVTLNKRATDRIEFVLHLGAKVKADANTTTIQDPKNMLKWLGKDRAMMTILDRDDLRAKEVSIRQVIIEWIQHL